MTALASLVLIAGCTGLVGPRESPLPVSRGVFMPRLLARGVLTPANRVEIDSPVMTQLTWLATDGAMVRTGEVVAELSMLSHQTTRRQIGNQLRSAELSVEATRVTQAYRARERRLALRSAELDLARAREEYDRAVEKRDWMRILETQEDQRLREREVRVQRQRLAAQRALTARGFGVANEILDTERRLRVLALEASMAQRLLPWLRDEAHERDIFAAAQEVARASAALQLALAEQESLDRQVEADLALHLADVTDHASECARLDAEIASAAIRSPADGMLVHLTSYTGSGMEKVQTGDRVFPGIRFIAVQDAASAAVSFQVEQRDAGGLAPGWRVIFRPDARPDLLVAGRVASVAVMAVETEPQDPHGERIVEARAALDRWPADLRPGCAGTVVAWPDLGVATDVALVDRAAVVRDRSGWRARAGFAELPDGVALGVWAGRVAFAWNQAFVVHERPIAELSRVRVARRPMRRELVVPGETRARRRSLIAPRHQGRVATVLDDGTRVTKGQEIARLETSEDEQKATDLEVQAKNKREALALLRERQRNEARRLEQQVAIARGALSVARLERELVEKRRDHDEIINLQQQRDLIRERIRLATAEASLTADLARRGLKSALEVEEARLEVARHERDRVINARKLDLAVSGPTDRERRLAALAVSRAENGLEAAEVGLAKALAAASSAEALAQTELTFVEDDLARVRERLADARLLSPQDGMVILPEVFKMGQASRIKPGDQVYGMVPFMQVADPDSVELRLEVPEGDIGFVRVGQVASITTKVAPGRTFGGRVTEVGLFVQAEPRSRPDGWVEAWVAPEVNASRTNGLTLSGVFRPGVSGEVTLELYHRPDALVVPFVAMMPGPTGPWVVDGAGRPRPFAAALVDGLAGTVVAEGVTEGEELLVPDPLAEW